MILMTATEKRLSEPPARAFSAAKGVGVPIIWETMAEFREEGRAQGIVPDMLNFSRGPEGISSSPGASSTAASSSVAILVEKIVTEKSNKGHDGPSAVPWNHRLSPDGISIIIQSDRNKS
jgi:hypothetical protein